MNANELADELDDCGKFFEDRLYTEAATVLRQQANRIVELEETINSCYAVQKMQAEEVYKGNHRIEALKLQLAKYPQQGQSIPCKFTEGMQIHNEPVAWMDSVGNITKQNLGNFTPLYIHPHPDNLGLAESIIKQQQLKIDNLYENNARLDAEIDALKTHPVKEHFEDEPQAEELHEIMQSNAELTDEEIDEVVRRWFGNSRYDFSANTWRQFSRAILRKAQEK